MNKKFVYLLVWIGCFILTAALAPVANSLDPESALSTIMQFIVVGFLVAGIVFVVIWRNTCPACKTGKLVYESDEEGESYESTMTVKTGTSTVKNSKGKVVRTIDKTAEKAALITPIYKVYVCKECGHVVKRLKRGKEGAKVEKL